MIDHFPDLKKLMEGMKMKGISTILETIERKIEEINPGSAVNLSDIIGNHKEEEIIAATKMLLRKYGIEFTN